MIGTLNGNVLQALLEALPIEFSVVDEGDRVLAWNKHETRIFKRPTGAVGRDVRNCHPQKSLSKVEQILREMKSGSRDMARFWIDLAMVPGQQPRKVLIEYHALRDANGEYLGCLEVTQDITKLQALTGEKRLLS